MDSDIKKSTISQILGFCEPIMSKLENEDDVDAIYLTSPKRLAKKTTVYCCTKLKHLISQKKSLETFIKKRQQRVKVKVNNNLSDWVWVLLIISQGTVPGPLLFLILMIDINKNTQNANLGSFADDTRTW